MPLGGADEIGMNMYMYAVDGKIIVVDAGYGFLLDDYPGMELAYASPEFLDAYKDDIESGMASPSNYKDVDNCTSEAQVKRLIAFNKLQNIAKYLNGDWKPDFCCSEKKWSINEKFGNFEPAFSVTENGAKVYFISEYATKEAIRLMGKDSLNDLFSTGW